MDKETLRKKVPPDDLVGKADDFSPILRAMHKWHKAPPGQLAWNAAEDAIETIEDAMLDYGLRVLASNVEVTPVPGDTEVEDRGDAVAYLYRCERPGHTLTYASVDPNDSAHWPVDQWTSVTITPLKAA